ncbi:MAG: hypothetical protein WD397_16240 [Wenzhouxiangellaceae bacterium]
MQTSNLDALEKRTYRTAVDHGFFDLLLAAAMAAFTLVFVVSPWFVLALFPLVIAKQPLLRLFNREVVEPRAGHVRLGPMRLEQISTARKTAALVFIGLAFIVVRLGDTESPISTAAPIAWLAGNGQIQMAIIIGVGTAVAGWLFRLPRFMTYALVTVLAPVVASLGGLPAGTGWTISTLFVLTGGCRVLYRFIHENPEAAA